MTTRLFAIGTAAVCAASLVSTASALAGTRCVGTGPGCQRTIQAALTAAHDGDTIKVARGTYKGPITITKSVKLVGAGADATVIRGGGPVVTVGTDGAAHEPTVTISDVKITGGLATTTFGETFLAFGGGVFVPPGADDNPGATLTIRDSVIAGNRAAPAKIFDRDPGDTDAPACPDGPCSFGGANGAGIDSHGTLTLVHSVVAWNQAGGPQASDAIGAGVWSDRGSLTIVDSTIAHNRAVVTPPYSRFAEGGGVFVSGGQFTMRDSVVARNVTRLTSTFPSSVEMTAQAAGVFVESDTPATITRSAITGNDVSVYDPNGEPAAYDSGLLVLDSPLTMRDSVVSDNQVTSLTQTTEDIGPAGAAFEVHAAAKIDNVRVVDNVSLAKTTDGTAWVTGGVVVYELSDSGPQQVTFTGGLISGNTATAISDTGTALTQGGGVYNNGLLELRKTLVTLNVGKAFAPSGSAEGGGIWNGVGFTGPPVDLRLTDSLITGNALVGGTGIERHGGGVFTSEPGTVERTRTRITGNAPDQCFGCG
jgi:hypothetical protein